MTVTKRKHLAPALLVLWALLPSPATAVNEKGDWPWELKLHGWHDRAVAEDLGAGWFMNVGPTGIRARITHEHPKYFTVKYVFKKSPAAGLVEIDDIIVGANGKKLTVEHTFGRRNIAGWEGPMLDMSKLIEDSQGKDGKLELIVWPAGVKEAEKTVTLQLEPIGRFSPTWPYDCPRSDKLLAELCEFLADEYKRAGKFEKMTHTHSSCVLALMAAGDKKHDSLVRKLMDGYGKKRYDSTHEAGFPAWGQVHDGIVMGEYYLLTKDRSLVPAIESLAACLNDSVWPQTGGLSHKPFAAIQRRMAAGGPKGYGAMAMPGGLGMVALSLFKAGGLEHAEPAYNRLHQGFLCSVAQNGGIGYGFNSWDHAVIELADPKGTPKNSPQGIGFECLDGMEGIGDYEITWPTKADPRYKPTNWLRTEMATNRVFDRGKGSRLVVRTMAPDEPKKSYKYGGGSFRHHGRSGVGALAHSIGNADNESWGHLSDLMATGCAKSYRELLDGHASTHMHVLWGTLGAALAEEKDFREYLDYNKWWMIMAQAHDGGFVVLPGRDYASTDHVYATRNFPTACAALILALKEKRLQITGAPRGPGDGTEEAADTTASSGRKARTLAPEKRTMLDSSLLTALAELSHAGELEPLPMDLTKARSKVSLTKVESDGRLTFQTQEGEHRASFTFADLGTEDHSLLSRLVARLRPDDPEAQARAGIYMELSGQTALADEFYEKAGPEIGAMLDELFE